MANGDFKNFTRRTASDKILHEKAFNISQNPKFDEYQKDLTSMTYTFLNKESASVANKSAFSNGISNKNVSNKELAERLYKPFTRKIQEKKSTPTFYRQKSGLLI